MNKPVPKFVLALLAVSVLLGASRNGAEAKTVLRANSQWNETHAGSQVDKWWAEEIKKRTNGEVEIKLFFGGALGKAQENLPLLRAGIANMTPFRGPSMDVGTAFELGYLAALGRPVLGYSNSARSFPERTLAYFGLDPAPGDGEPPARDPLGLAIENFGMADNLMLDGAILDAGFEVVTRQVDDPDRLYRDLTGFEACVEALAARRETGR